MSISPASPALANPGFQLRTRHPTQMPIDFPLPTVLRCIGPSADDDDGDLAVLYCMSDQCAAYIASRGRRRTTRRCAVLYIYASV